MTRLLDRARARLLHKKQLRLQIAQLKRERLAAVNRSDTPARKEATRRIIELQTVLNDLKRH